MLNIINLIVENNQTGYFMQLVKYLGLPPMLLNVTK
jgi:hypothetical protein